MIALSPEPVSTGNAFREGWNLMSSQEKRRAILLAIGIVGVGLVDALALTSVLPVVHLITDPAALERNRTLGELHRFFGEPPITQLFPLLAGVSILLLFLSSLLRLASEYVTYRLSASCQARLAGELLAGALNAPYDWGVRQSPTKLARLVQNDVTLWANSFVRRVGTIANAWVTGVVAIGLVVVLSPGPILVVLTIVGLVSWGSLYLSKPLMGRLALVHRTASESIAVVSHQALSGLKDVKMTNSAPMMLRLFNGAVIKFGRAVAANNNLRQLPSAMIMFLGQAALIVVTLILWWSGTSTGEIASQAALLALASSRMIPAMNRVSGGAGVLWDALPYMHGIVALKAEIEAAQTVNIAVNKNPVFVDWNRIAFENVSYRYPSATEPAIDQVSFALERGKAYGIVGPSGAGKSTVVDLLAGLLSPEKGQVSVEGVSLQELTSTSWRDQIGYVSQAPFILDDSLRANVAFGVDASGSRDDLIWECLRQAHLEDVTLALERGLDTRLGDRGLMLSGGQRQRIAIARALYRRPQLLILDEATSALDGISERAIQAAITELHGHITVVTVAHRLTAIRDCDEILLFHKGSLVAHGDYDSLLATSPLFRELAARYDDALSASSGDVERLPN